MSTIAKFFLPILLTVVVALPSIAFSGCDDTTESSIQICEEYLTALNRSDYGACYGYLASTIPEELTQAAFIDRHTTIYEAIQRTNMTWKLAEIEQEDYSAASAIYDILYQSSLLEPFTVRITIPLVYEQLRWRIDWSPAMFFPEMDWTDEIRLTTLKPKRGEILDSEANPYAINAYGDTVFVNTSTVENIDATAASLASLLRMDAADIRKTILTTQKNGLDIAVIKTYLPNTIDASLSELLIAIQGVGIDRSQFSPMRYYPQMSATAHLVGYTAPVDKETLQDLDPARYDADSRKGTAGLESAYEDEMTGYRGFDISILSEDGSRTSVVRQEAIDGMDLELTLDYELQVRAHSLLGMLEDDQAGVIIVIDPKTGDLLAAANHPTFDPNIFTFPITDYNERFNDPEKNAPLFPRYTMGGYPPGSTVKPLVAAMALENDVVDTSFVFTQEIDWRKQQWTPSGFGEWYYPPITRVSNYDKPMNMENAIIRSDNIYFAYIALTAKWDLLKSFYDSCGLGQSIPFDMAVIKPNIVADGEETNLHQLASSGFGQGKMTVSPLQMAYTFSVFANEGDIMRPRLVKSLRRMDEMQYDVVREVPTSVWLENVLDKSTIDTINPMLRKVISEGSGREGRLDDIVTLGKTGTAELDDSKQREIAWSISFVESEDYSRLVCVMLEVASKEGEHRHRCVREMLLP